MLLNYHIGCIVLGLQSKNNTANVAVQQHSFKLLKMDILMPETC